MKPGSRARGSIALAMGIAAVHAASAQESETAIEEIVVTAAGYQQNIADAPASITVIPAAELQTRQVRDLADALSSVEGVDVGAPLGKNGGRTISLRGLPAEYTLFLVDGRRQDAAGNVTPNGFGHTRSSFMPPSSAIERIEVVRGPMSTLYGADALGGVVNVITRMPRDKWSGQVKVDGTKQTEDNFGDDYSGSFYLDGPLAEQLSLALRGSRYHRDETRYEFEDAQGNRIEDGGIAGGAAIAAADVDSIGARLTYSPAAGHLIWLDADTNEQVYDNSEGALGTLGSGGYLEEMEFKREQYLLAYSGDVLGGFLDADLTRNMNETIGRTLPADVQGTNRRAGDPRQIEATNDIFNIKFHRSLGDHTFTLGSQYWEAEMIEGLNPESFEHTQKAFFVEDEWRLLNPVALTLGARYDDHSVFGSNLSPRAYLVVDATSTLTVKGGVSRGYKAPGLDQLADGIVGFGGQGTIPLLGTPTLEPETSTNYEVGLYYNPGTGLTANATIYESKFEDKIARGPGVPNCSFGITEEEYLAGQYILENCKAVGYYPTGRGGPIAEFGQSVNVDEAETQGIELALRTPIMDSFKLSMNYTWSDSEQLSGSEKGEPLTFLPEHRVTSRIGWEVSQALSLWMDGQYNSNRGRGTGASNVAAEEQLGEFESYYLFNLGGSYQFTDNLQLSATLYNLLDTDFIDYSAYEYRGEPAYANAYAIAEDARRLWLSLSMTF